jgi:hypothetical protein
VTDFAILLMFLLPLTVVAVMHTCEPRDGWRPEVLR